MTSRQIEMTWRCTSCSARNLGRFKVCQTCANPKDGSEEYEMPDDPSKAVSVTEEALLRMATAGPNWRCAYCGSDQRRADAGCGNCGASAVEGAEVPDAPKPVLDAAPVRSPAAAPPPRRWGRTLLLVGFGLAMSCVVLSALASWNRDRPRDHDARVTDVHWERVIEIERYQAVAHEGFKEAMPGTAQKVKSLGQREHHREDVLDHYDTEHYSVEVPDGYRTESYTERVSCGEDCSTTPKSCREHCTSNKNGFATCSQQCTGGDRRCSTRYCNERRTRQVAKTRSEMRSRQVPRYRSEPRFAEAFTWLNWEWVPARISRAQGTDVTPRWPETKPATDLAPEEHEREHRTERYSVTLGYGDDSLTLAPADEAAFSSFAPGSKHSLHTEKGVFTLDGAVVQPVRP